MLKDERPVFTFKPDYDVKIQQQFITVKGTTHVKNRDRPVEARLRIDDGTI